MFSRPIAIRERDLEGEKKKNKRERMKHGAKRGVCAPKKLKLARLETCAHIRSDQREREREGEEGRSERSLLKLLHRHRSCHDQKTPQGSAVSVRPSVQGVRGREEEEEEEEQEGHGGSGGGRAKGRGKNPPEEFNAWMKPCHGKTTGRACGSACTCTRVRVPRTQPCVRARRKVNKFSLFSIPILYLESRVVPISRSLFLFLSL